MSNSHVGKTTHLSVAWHAVERRTHNESAILVSLFLAGVCGRRRLLFKVAKEIVAVLVVLWWAPLSGDAG